ncbi:pentapeptide repeat-containing protein [Cypionkella sp.]|uniref:pentapeptide repeat-containing protein n=1 Tax=Cypionkella sp. TaxID=2811411 RepID=UPI003751B25F
MYIPEVTIIAMPPQDFWGATFIFGLLFATGLIYLALGQADKPYRAPAWESLSPLALAIIIPLAILWAALFLLAVWAAFWATYQLLQPHAATSSPQTSGLGALGLGTLLAGLLGAPFVIWGTVLKHRTVGFQKEGHLTDRISKAVEQLGAEKTVKRAGSEETLPNIEVRIGGILSLERIAQDSTDYDHGRDHVRCMEILCAYIRENAPASGAKDHRFGEWEPLKDDPTDAERVAHLEKRKARFGSHRFESKVYRWAKNLPEPRADIALALQVLGRRTAAQRQAEARWGKDASPDAEWVFESCWQSLPEAADDQITTAAELAAYQAKLWAWKTKINAYRGYRLDLRKTNLQGADLSNLILSGTILFRARMEGANLMQARLEGANLVRARLEGAELCEVQMEGANLMYAWLEGADFDAARSEGADVLGARMG